MPLFAPDTADDQDGCFARPSGKSRAAIHANVKQLAHIEPTRTAASLLESWLIIGAVLVVCWTYRTPWILGAAFVLIGALQYRLLILLHDAQHSLLHPKRAVNDRLGFWLLAAPCGSSFYPSRRLHLLHHQNLGDRTVDPDFHFYCSDAPAPKRPFWYFVKYFGELASGLQVIRDLFRRYHQPVSRLPGEGEPTGLRLLLSVAFVQFAFLFAFAAAGWWWGYFLLWALPLVTLAALLNGVRTFCDHAIVGPDVPPEERDLISYASNPLERFFFAPYHMNYHAEHHFFPYVPHYNLPRLRAILRGAPEYEAAIQWRQTYLGFLWRYIRAG
jgi:fatty acid desaturase